MKDFTIPTPQDSGYETHQNIVDDVLMTIQHAIRNQSFKFEPKSNWRGSNLIKAVNTEISKFGWILDESWTGSRDDGHSMWVLKPL